jgi:hypothetical protein
MAIKMVDEISGVVCCTDSQGDPISFSLEISVIMRTSFQNSANFIIVLKATAMKVLFLLRQDSQSGKL